MGVSNLGSEQRDGHINAEVIKIWMFQILIKDKSCGQGQHVLIKCMQQFYDVGQLHCALLEHKHLNVGHVGLGRKHYAIETAQGRQDFQSTPPMDVDSM